MLPYVAFRFLQLRRAGQYSGGYFSIASDRAPSAVMPRNMYRFAVVLLLVLYPWFVEITAVGDAASRNSLIAFLGLALQGTAAIGLWSDERWAALVLLAAASVSAYTRFGVAGESVVMLPLVALRFYQVHRAHRTTVSPPSPEPRAGHGTR